MFSAIIPIYWKNHTKVMMVAYTSYTRLNNYRIQNVYLLTARYMLFNEKTTFGRSQRVPQLGVVCSYLTGVTSHLNMSITLSCLSCMGFRVK